LQDCNKANQTRSVHVNLIKLGTFREQLYDETVYKPLTDSEPPRQPAVLLRTLRNLNLNATGKTHGHFYDDDDAARLRAAPAAAAAADAAAAAGNGPMQGGGDNIQGHGNLLPALQNPPTPDLQIDTRVQSTSDDSDDFDDYENALDRTIISDS
jgi:hypothetical protein